MNLAASNAAHTAQPMPLFAHVVEAWAVAATLVPALLFKFGFF